MRALDLFSGAAAGWTLGLHRAGIETVAACEADPWRRAVYARNFPGVRIYDDVRTLTGERVLADVGAIDLLAGSPPCQDASLGRREARTGIDGERTGLFVEALRLVRELRPDWVCLENVPGIVGVGHDRIAASLAEAGYRTWLFDMGAEDFGATHKRRRLWFIALADADEEGPADAWRQPGTTWARGIGAAVGSLQVAGNPWRQGEGDALRVADGFPAHVGSGRCTAAYGDAVCPQITEAIGRAILGIDAARRLAA